MSYPSTATYAASSFLIYSCFTTGNKVSGSLLIDCASTEAEAQEKKLMYEKRSLEFNARFPRPEGDVRSICYINNKTEWWTRATNKIESL